MAVFAGNLLVGGTVLSHDKADIIGQVGLTKKVVEEFVLADSRKKRNRNLKIAEEFLFLKCIDTDVIGQHVHSGESARFSISRAPLLSLL